MSKKRSIDLIRIYFIFGVTLIISGCLAGRTSTASPTALAPIASEATAAPTMQPAFSVPSPTRASDPTPTQIPATPRSSPTPLTAQSTVLTGFSGAVTNLAWSPDGALLASSSGGFQTKDFDIRIWKPDGSLEDDLTGHTQPVTDLAWSPDGKILASSSLDGSVRLWNRDGTLRQELNGDAGGVFAVAWSPDGQILATGAIVTFTNPTVQLWNPAGQVMKTLSTAFSGGKFYNLAWSPDGRYLLGGATDYKLWRADGEQVFWLKSCSHCTPSWAMAWSPDGQILASGSDDKTIRLWKIK
jgi:WD40 repeat protein